MNPVPRSVLCVCLGNICRSPVAEYLLRFRTQQSADSSLQPIIFASAGIHAGINPISPHSQTFLIQRGIETNGFLSQPTTRELLDQFDLILVMESYMKSYILDSYYQDLSPEDQTRRADQIVTIAVAGGGDEDIDDPWGEDWNVYRDVLEKIEAYVHKIVVSWESSI